MSMVVASTLPMRTRRPRVLSGLRGYFGVPDDATDVALVAVRRDSSGMLPDQNLGTAGRPLSLAVAYAKNPLLTFFGLIALGWAGGFATWYFFGRGRRTR